MICAPSAARAWPHHGRAAAPASASVTLLGLEEFARGLRSLHPPPAYRLSLDSGIEYKNVRRALERPLVLRLGTWRRLLRSLRVRMVAAACAEDVIWPGAQTRVVAFGAEADALVSPGNAVSLRQYRVARGWSRRELARRAAVSVDAVSSVECNRGTIDKLARVCAALDLRLLLALPPWHGTLQSLWEERAARCLSQPAQYPPAPRRLRAR